MKKSLGILIFMLILSNVAFSAMYIKGSKTILGYIDQVDSTNTYEATQVGDLWTSTGSSLGTTSNLVDRMELESGSYNFFIEYTSPGLAQIVETMGLQAFEGLEGGIGFGYISNPKILDSEKTVIGNNGYFGYGTIPIYLIAKYNAGDPAIFNPYTIIKIGGNVPLLDTGGMNEVFEVGGYAGLGFGLEFGGLQLEALYQLSTMSIKYEEKLSTYYNADTEIEEKRILIGTNDYYHSQFTIMAGLRFSTGE